MPIGKAALRSGVHKRLTSASACLLTASRAERLRGGDMAAGGTSMRSDAGVAAAERLRCRGGDAATALELACLGMLCLPKVLLVGQTAA